MCELTTDRPKCLAELHGRALIDWQLNAFHRAGIDVVGIVTGYRAEHLRGRATREFHNESWETTNMVASLRRADEWLASDVCVISYSDIVYTPSAISVLIESDSAVAITFDPNWHRLWSRRFADPLSDAESFRLGTRGQLLEIGGRPTTIDEVEGQYMGLIRTTPPGWLHMRRLLDGLPVEEQRTMQMTHLLNLVAREGTISVACAPYTGPWAEVDSEQDLAVAVEVMNGHADRPWTDPLIR